MQRKTPPSGSQQAKKKPALPSTSSAPSSSRIRMEQDRERREQAQAAEQALKEASDAYVRDFDLARANLYDDEAWKTYERAYKNYWQQYVAIRDLAPETRSKMEATLAAFPPGYARSYWQAKAGDGRNLEPLVLFLEADPYVYRSGYEKEAAITALKQVKEIPPQYAARLRDVILHIVDTRWGQEFRAYCRLARKVDAPELRAALELRLSHPKWAYPDAQKRARRVLEMLWQKDRMEPRKA